MNSVCAMILLTFSLTLSFGDAGLWCFIKKREDFASEQNPSKSVPQPTLSKQKRTAKQISNAREFQCFPGLHCKRTITSSRGAKPQRLARL